MISRRKILSRSRDDVLLDYRDNYNPYEDEDDVWFQKDKLFKDHIQEVLNKWEQIDDEIWAKVICMERNRRVAKAYARASVITINGSDVGFDGYRIGLNGFENEYRDTKVGEAKKLIGQGVKVKMDETGNILIKRIGKSNVYVKGWSLSSQNSSGHDSSVGSEIIRNGGKLEQDKAVKMFDMNKFQVNIEKEISSAYPDRRMLENQCISVFGFVKDAEDILDLPVWIMLINVVAMEMLKSKLPITAARRRNPTRLPFDKRESTNLKEEIYAPIKVRNSSTSSGSAESIAKKAAVVKVSSSPPLSSSKPPKLPPRDMKKFGHKDSGSKTSENDSKIRNSKQKDKVNRPELPMPDYDDGFDEEDERIQERLLLERLSKSKRKDDPYYCGMKAKTSNFKPNPSRNQINRNGGTKANEGSHHLKSNMNRNIHNFYLFERSGQTRIMSEKRLDPERKCQSTSYLNSYLHPSLYSDRSLYPSWNDSSIESDPYTSIRTSYFDSEDIYGALSKNAPRKSLTKPSLPYTGKNKKVVAHNVSHSNQKPYLSKNLSKRN